MLSPDVRMVVDSGDETGGETRGRSHVIRELEGRLARHPDASLVRVHANGHPGLALRRPDGRVIGVAVIEGSESIRGLWISTAPRKLASWNRRRPQTD
ncbi:hypothetical protein GCM10009761_02400 [Agromyces terreus]